MDIIAFVGVTSRWLLTVVKPVVESQRSHVARALSVSDSTAAVAVAAGAQTPNVVCKSFIYLNISSSGTMGICVFPSFPPHSSAHKNSNYCLSPTVFCMKT